MAKQYFGEEQVKKTKRKTAAKATVTKRAYTRRAPKQELVTIQVPASLAFQLGVQIGQLSNA